jgi:hypothetical protein
MRHVLASDNDNTPFATAGTRGTRQMYSTIVYKRKAEPQRRPKEPQRIVAG